MFNLLTLVKAIEKIGTAIPNVNTVVLSDIYKLNELPDIDYSVFAIVQDIHRQDNDYFYFNFYLYYVDRLLNDKSNQLEIQSHGIQLLSTVISKIEQLGLILNRDLMENTYQSFHQRFSDECSGVFARIEVQVPIDCTIPYDILVNPLLADLSTWQAGVYNPEDFGVDGFRTVTVSGQSFHYFTENEGDKTATIDNGHHNINVTKSGATYDGYPIVNTQTLSAYTYNKADTLNLCQYEIGQALSPVKAQVSANTEDIAELSGSTVALSASTQGSINATNNNLQSLSAATQNAVSSITDTIQALSAATEGTTSAITNDLSTLSASTETLSAATQSEISAITQNLAELSGNTQTLSAGTQDAINAITGQISAITGNISAITDEIETVSANTIANANGIETLSAATQNEISAITENLSTLSASTVELSGRTVTNTNDIAAISGNTYNKNETDERISQTATYYYNQLEPRVAQNERDIAELSGNTIALSASTVSNANDIATISAATSSNTVDIIILSGQTSANTGNINILSGLTSANTENIATLSAMTDDFVMKEPTYLECTTASTVDLNDLVESGYYYINSHNIQIANFIDYGGVWCPSIIVHVIRKDVWDSTISGYSQEIVQVATTPLTDGSTGVTTDYWPRRWYRIKGWNDAIAGNGWSRWEEIATNANAYMTDALYVVGSSAQTVDYDEFIGKGGYYFIRNYGYSANGPRPNLWDGILEVVWKFDGNGLQRYTEMIDDAPHSYLRYGNWGVFTDWYEYTLTPVNQQ